LKWCLLQIRSILLLSLGIRSPAKQAKSPSSICFCCHVNLLSCVNYESIDKLCSRPFYSFLKFP
jgi:hypothetical protein